MENSGGKKRNIENEIKISQWTDTSHVKKERQVDLVGALSITESGEVVVTNTITA